MRAVAARSIPAMRYLLSSLTVVLLLTAYAFAPVAPKATVLLTLQGCADGDPVSLLEFDGFDFTPFATAKVKDGSAKLEIPRSEHPRIYYVGTGKSNMRPFLLGTEEEVKVTGNCAKFSAVQVSSPLNASYAAMKAEMQRLKQQTQQNARQFQLAQRSGQSTEAFVARMAELDTERLTLIAKYKAIDLFLRDALVLNTYQSFQHNNPDNKYPNEIDYFVNEYFSFANWENPAYDYQAWVYEAMKAYTETLSSINLPAPMHQRAIEVQLAKIPQDRRSYLLAYGGVLTGLQGKNHPNYGVFAESLLKSDVALSAATKKTIQDRVASVTALAVGGTPPDIVLPTPEGDELKLSDLRGKVVLVDFWASWCGPCRRENPNVKKVYEKYKDQGFDILGVSLDQKNDAWVNAIAKDGLEWHHISDLKGWQSAAAAAYGVRSIPATFLLDADGKIIARNLRGDALEAKLKEVFGG